MAKKIARPKLAKDPNTGEWWMEYEGNLTNELHHSPNGRWVCGIFRLQERVLLLLTSPGKVEYRFIIPIPLVCSVSDSGVAATVEFAEGGQKRLSFFFPDGAVAKTEPIKELQQTDRIFFDKKFAEVNLLSEGRILNTFHFGELEATVNSNALLYKRPLWVPVLLATGVVLAIVLLFVFFHK
ncbi:MAG: hypothetical protein NTZ46_02860 [Verrucomicrobia bacterium]|nr:hypothetical protein [Verrucomicrobiota bacterium]